MTAIGLSTSYLGRAQTCPAYGADSDCGTIITITDTGSTVTSTGQGPYDGADDTLVGVVNKSKIPIHALQLGSLYGIFGFDGDGVDTYGSPGNAIDTTGYGGPNAYYTNISPDTTSGVVNFITPIPPGGKAYFSLENAISSAISCQDVVNGGLKAPAKGPLGSPNIQASFTPRLGYSLAQAAFYCGFVNFDWVQRVTHLNDPSLYYARNLGGAFDPAIKGSVNLTSSRTPFNDPPMGGGYTYSAAPDYSYPFYYNATTSELTGQETGGVTLTFHDAPGNGCLPGGKAAGTATCKGATEPAGSYMGFTNHLAGVNADGTATDLGVGFVYTSDYNGTTGGVYVAKALVPADGNGTGGVTVDSVVENTTYQYNGLTVKQINPTPTGSIYVADKWRVQEFTTAGTYVSQFVIDSGGRFEFGPAGVAVDASGNVFLSDIYNKTIAEFDSTGKFVHRFGAYGSGHGQFLNGFGALAVDSTGDLFVTDAGNNRVQIFTNAGAYKGQFGTQGRSPGQFEGPVAVAVDSSNNVYVADSERVQKFSTSGTFLSQFTFKTGGRFLFGPAGIAVDASGDVFLTDVASKDVVEFNAAGAYVSSFGSYGSANGQFLNGIGTLAIDAGGDIIVADSGNSRVQDFNSSGVYQSQFGAIGTSNGEFEGSIAVTVSAP